MPREILVDPHVHELAEFWLSNDDTVTKGTVHEKRVMSLAQCIQQAVEAWCEEEAEEATHGQA